MSAPDIGRSDTGSPLDHLQAERSAFRDELIAAGLLIRTSVDGLYGRSGDFEYIIDLIDERVRAAGAAAHGDSARVLRFPPVFPVDAFERTDYLASFPNLTGAITTFTGDNKDHAELLAARSEGRDWNHYLTPAGTVLVSAACHPSYAQLTGTLPAEGVLMDILGYCFRHEPAVDPARMQAFRMHEFVRVGTEADATEHRAAWVERGLSVLADLGLEAEAVIANDPFFGRAGRMLAANQRNENLKTELVVRLYGDLDDGTAVVSCNNHRDHFGDTFEIRTADGTPAHSACVGFGMERIALALVRRYGTEPRNWPLKPLS